MALNTLDAKTVQNVKPGEKPQKLFDGGGLYLLIQPTGGKLWRLKYRIGGKEKLLSLGVYPQVGLKDARDRRDKARQDIAQGIDPSNKRKAEKTSRATLAANSFEVVAREWHLTIHKPKVSEGHAARTLVRLEQDVFPWLGAEPSAHRLLPS